jgi:hypothetical protein
MAITHVNESFVLRSKSATAAVAPIKINPIDAQAANGRS